MNTIYYNNKDLFSGVCLTPYVAYRYETDGVIYGTTSLTLEGLIVSDNSCNDPFVSISTKQDLLIARLSENYKKLQIKENNSLVFSSDYANIQEVNFERSEYVYGVPFSINIDCYDYNNFSGAFFIKDPRDVFTIRESDNNNTVSVVHSIEAKAVNSDNLAIQNAKNWVYGQSGLKNFVTPTKFQTIKNNLILTSIKENVNRFDGSYKLDETYIYDKNFNENMFILRYNTDTNVSKNNFNTVTLRGELFGGLASDINLLRNSFKQLNFYDIAADGYFLSTNLRDLSRFYLSSGVNENSNEKKIDFNIQFDNNNTNLVNVDSTAAISEGFSYDSQQSSATLRSVISCRFGNLDERLSQVYNYYKNVFNRDNEFLNNIASMFNYNFSWFRLGSENVSIDERKGTITYNCSWNIHKNYSILNNKIKNTNIRISEEGKKQVYNFRQPLCSDWYAQKSYVTKKICSIEGTIEMYDTATAVPTFYKDIANARIPNRIVRQDTVELKDRNNKVYNVVYQVEEL